MGTGVSLDAFRRRNQERDQAIGVLNGKIALVTGSTSGIGAAIARVFWREGATVILHGLDPQSEVELSRELDAIYIPADLEIPGECARLIGEVSNQFGKLDILVNNAAIVPRADLRLTDESLFDRVIAINLRAPLILIRQCLPLFKTSGGGSVVNIGSVNAYCGEPELLAYSISKGGLMTLTRNLSDALGPEGIRVNQLNIGWVLTEREQMDMVARGHKEDWSNNIATHLCPSGRIFTPEQIAEYVLAFSNDQGGFVSGTIADIQQFPMIGRNPNKSPEALE